MKADPVMPEAFLGTEVSGELYFVVRTPAAASAKVAGNTDELCLTHTPGGEVKM
jgi:hypothetical protein